MAKPPLPWVIHHLPLVVDRSQRAVEEESIALDRFQALKSE